MIELLNKQSCPSPLLCDKNCKYAHLESCYAERVADYLLSNGVIVPPCKVGDVVYVIFNDKIHKATVHNMKIETENDYYAVLIKVRVFDQISLFKTFLLGKTVFLTKEEAEQALKGGEQE